MIPARLPLPAVEYPAVDTFCRPCTWWQHAVSACVRAACCWRWQRIGFEDRQRRDLADGKARVKDDR